MSGRFPSFKDLEHAGWSANAESYHALAGAVTSQAAAYLLDAAGVGNGSKVLDVACGPGYGSAAAAERGAQPIGIDFAAPVVKGATRRHPGLEFCVGDAEALAFDDKSFDAVICSFGLLHLGQPEKAVSEALRVLRSGGRYAFTVWCAPHELEYFGLISKAVEKHGTLDVGLPPGPDFYRFSDHNESRVLLLGAGFIDPQVIEVELFWRPTSADDFLTMIYKSTAGARMLLERQSAEARDRIHRTILDAAEDFRAGDGFEVVWRAVLASGQRPPAR